MAEKFCWRTIILAYKASVNLDIKSDNVLISAKDTAVLWDFSESNFKIKSVSMASIKLFKHPSTTLYV